MVAKIVLLFLCCTCVSFSKDAILVVTEITLDKSPDTPPAHRFKEGRIDTPFALDVRGFMATRTDKAHGAEVSRTSKYFISDRQLRIGDRLRLPADEILTQGSVDGTDVVVTRRSYTSANPLYWFMALSGHPAQFSEIVVVLVNGDNSKTINLTTQLSQSNASNWQAALFAQDTDR